MNRILALFCLCCEASLCVAEEPKISVPIFNVGDRFELIGKLGVKLGETTTVEGTVIEGPSKGYESGPNLVVKRVNGTATQSLIQIPISPYFGKFGEATFDGEPVTKCENGTTYRLRGYETGEFVGVPVDAYDEAGISFQSTGFYFRSSLVVISWDEIDPVAWDPVDFLDRDALFSGVARNEDGIPIIESSTWKLILSDADIWDDTEIGKLAEVFGLIRAVQAKNTYRVENCRKRLISLDDQLGKIVTLRGTARSRNGHWWFNYRGTDMYVEDIETLPNWTSENHWRPMEITGRLEQAALQRIDQISIKSNPDSAIYYIVKSPQWAPVNELLTPELLIDK